jgi:hypothetical protein
MNAEVMKENANRKTQDKEVRLKRFPCCKHGASAHVLTAVPPKGETEMLGATNRIIARYCDLSQKDERLG